MVFDGLTYTRADLVVPIAYHPKAALTGPALGQVLQNSYVAGRFSARLAIQTVYARNFRSPNFTRALPDGFASTAYTRIGEGFRYIPASATHCVAQVSFGISALEDVTATHRIVLDNGAGAVDTGTATTTAATSALLFAARQARVAWHGWQHQVQNVISPFVEPVFQPPPFEVAIANNTGASKVEVYVEVKATLTRDTSIAASLFPYSVTAWWETRG